MDVWGIVIGIAAVLIVGWTVWHGLFVKKTKKGCSCDCGVGCGGIGGSGCSGGSCGGKGCTLSCDSRSQTGSVKEEKKE